MATVREVVVGERQTKIVTADSDVRRITASRMARWAYGCLLAAAFAIPVSLPAGRGLLAATLVLCLAGWALERRRPVVPPVLWWAMAWVALAVVVTLLSPYLIAGKLKLDKLAWWIGIVAVTEVVNSRTRVWAVCQAYVLGCGALAVRSLVETPWRGMALVREGRFPTLGDAIVHLGSMTDSQRLLVGMILALGLLWMARKSGPRARWLWGGLLMLLISALILNFKRGSWLCALIGGGCFLLLKGGWKAWALALLLIVAALSVPVTRTRLVNLGDEFKPTGGRMTMWFEIAPVLIREHPWGIGERTLTNRMMRKIAPKVERNRNHLHSNIVQVLVSTGWLGLALYLGWMFVAVADAGRAHRRAGNEAFSGLSLATALALVTLFLNGLVEYNMGDAEIVLIYVLLMGLGAVGVRMSAAAPLNPDPQAIAPTTIKRVGKRSRRHRR